MRGTFDFFATGVGEEDNEEDDELSLEEDEESLDELEEYERFLAIISRSWSNANAHGRNSVIDEVNLIVILIIQIYETFTSNVIRDPNSCSEFNQPSQLSR